MCHEINSFPRITALKNCAGVSLAQFLCLVLTKNNQISGCEAVFEVQIFSKGKVETRRKPDGFQGMRQSISENLPSKTNTSLRKGPQGAFFCFPKCKKSRGERKPLRYAFHTLTKQEKARRGGIRRAFSICVNAERQRLRTGFEGRKLQDAPSAQPQQHCACRQ